MELALTKEYQTGEWVFKNAQLTKATQTIATNMKSSKLAFCKAATALRKIQNEKLFQDDFTDAEGKPSFSSYCENVLGISKSAAYRIMNTAEHLLVPELDIKDPNQVFFKNFGDTALSIIDETTENYEDAKAFCEKYDITEITPQKAIREFGKMWKAAKKGNSSAVSMETESNENADVVNGKTSDRELKSLVGQFFRSHLNALIEVDGEFANLVKEIAEKW